jgi:UMF1 family MFS transporter
MTAPVAHTGVIGLDQPARLRAVTSWVLYDLANTIFSMGVVSLYFPEWMRSVVGKDEADSAVARVVALSMGIIFIVSPLLGSMSDRARRRMPFLIVSTGGCVVCTLLLVSAGYWGSVIAFVAANAFYQAGLQFYDSLLVEVTTDSNRGRIGGIGVGIGYVGSFIAIAIGLIAGKSDFALLFILIGLLFLAFAIPCFLFVKERGNPNPGPLFNLRFIVSSTRETVRALRQSERFPGLGRFLAGRVFYTDAINTVIAFMTLVALNVLEGAGRSAENASDEKDLIMGVAILFAIAGGFVWGRIVDRLGPKQTLDIVLYWWIATFALAAAMGLFGLPPLTLWFVSSMAGIGLGGVWSADRPLMLRLTPPNRIGEFYGLYGMVGRFSAILGPVLWWAVTSLSQDVLHCDELTSQGFAIAALLVMVVTGWSILRSVNDRPRDWAALQSL